MDTQHKLTRLLQLRGVIHNVRDAVFDISRVVHKALLDICYTCGAPSTTDRHVDSVRIDGTVYAGQPYALCPKCFKKVRRGTLKVIHRL